MKTIKLVDIADVIRSKNAGPYELTMDILFKTEQDYLLAVEKEVINEQTIASLYQIDKEDIIGIVNFSPAKAIKVTIKRPLPSGSLGETDVYGAQQHAPLLDIAFEK